MKEILKNGDQIVSTQFHEGNILIFTLYGEIFVMSIMGDVYEYTIKKIS